MVIADSVLISQTGGSYKTSPNLGSIQVLHNVSAPSSPKPTAPAAMSEDAAKQVGEVLGLVKELKEARSLQTQQTTDIARCRHACSCEVRADSRHRSERAEFLAGEVRPE